MTINFTPLLDSLICNVVLFGICVYIFRRRQKETLYNRLSTWYFICFLLISFGAPMVTAMSSLKSWDELSSIQWTVLVISVLVNACNTMLAFITQAAKRVKEGDGLVPTNGNGHAKESPTNTETQTTETTVKT